MLEPLFGHLQQYAQNPRIPFHMPGHKLGQGLELGNVLKYDITEIPDFDNLHHAQSVIKQAQELFAKTFGAQESFFVVNGSTCGIQAAILSVCAENEKIIVARNCHRSVYSGFIFSGAIPIFLLPEKIPQTDILGGICIDKLQKLIHENPEAKAIIITSPTYEGITSDIKMIAQLAHQNNMVLIVDEAHGAHFHFHNYFPKTSLQQGADIVIQSIHKTLPAMTQCSVIHIQGNYVNRKRLQQFLSMLQTSSPSYIFMGALDHLRAVLDQEGDKLFDAYVKRLQLFRQRTSNLSQLALLGKEIVGSFSVADIDLGKLVFKVNKRNFTGVDIENYLLKQYQIQLEMSSLHHLLAMTSISDKSQWLDQLEKAMFEINKKMENYTQDIIVDNFEQVVPHCVLTPREAVFSLQEAVPFWESKGRVSAEFMIAYPPGIPLLAPGEKITIEILQKVLQLKEKGIDIVGMEDNYLQTLIVVK